MLAGGGSEHERSTVDPSQRQAASQLILRAVGCGNLGCSERGTSDAEERPHPSGRSTGCAHLALPIRSVVLLLIEVVIDGQRRVAEVFRQAILAIGAPPAGVAGHIGKA